jgi:hypothetical protein
MTVPSPNAIEDGMSAGTLRSRSPAGYHYPCVIGSATKGSGGPNFRPIFL